MKSRWSKPESQKRKGIRLSQGASAGDDVIQLAVTVSGAPAADALKKQYEP